MWNFTSPQNQALTLLHEMGHVLANMGWTGGLFANDDSDEMINKMNQDFITKACSSDVN
jgi:hypothetical protein